jgi:hypothetical protein
MSLSWQQKQALFEEADRALLEDPEVIFRGLSDLLMCHLYHLLLLPDTACQIGVFPMDINLKPELEGDKNHKILIISNSRNLGEYMWECIEDAIWKGSNFRLS